MDRGAHAEAQGEPRGDAELKGSVLVDVDPGAEVEVARGGQMGVDRLLFQKIENRSVDHNENLKAGFFRPSAISREFLPRGRVAPGRSVTVDRCCSRRLAGTRRPLLGPDRER